MATYVTLYPTSVTLLANRSMYTHVQENSQSMIPRYYMHSDVCWRRITTCIVMYVGGVLLHA